MTRQGGLTFTLDRAEYGSKDDPSIYQWPLGPYKILSFCHFSFLPDVYPGGVWHVSVRILFWFCGLDRALWSLTA